MVDDVFWRSLGRSMRLERAQLQGMDVRDGVAHVYPIGVAAMLPRCPSTADRRTL